MRSPQCPKHEVCPDQIRAWLAWMVRPWPSPLVEVRPRPGECLSDALSRAVP